VVLLALGIGVLLAGRAPAPLRLPLLAGTGAIRGLVLIAALLVLGRAESWWLQLAGFLATVAAAATVATGLVVTERALDDLGPGRGTAVGGGNRALGAGAPSTRPVRKRADVGERRGRPGWRR